MSFESEFLSIYNKKKKKQKEETITKTDSFTEELLKLRQNEINEFQQKKSQNTNTESEKPSGFLKKSEAYTDFGANNASKLGITALGTAGDITARILQGFGNQFEGIADIATYLVSGAADLVGADRFAEKSKKFAQTQWVDKFANQYMKDMEDFSILGDKSDAVSQGIGQVLAMYVTAGLGTKAKLGQKAVSALTTGTNFASATGHGLTEAYNEGATDGEAWGYGLLKGGAEAGSEAVFGGLGKGANALGIGKGLSSADDMLAKALTKKITNRFLSNAGQLAVKAGGEGLEEVLAGVGTAVAKKLSYKKNNGENLWKLIEDEKLFDSFITGALTSGIAQGSGAIRATKTDTDLVSGLNRKEENVVQAVYDSRLADKQKDGKKLSALEKNKLWDDIVTEMKRGELSTDDIERVLGGDTYTEYKSRLDQVENIKKKIDALQTEHDDLNAMKKSDMTGVQEDRLAELKKELPKLKSQYKHWTSETKAQEVADLKAKLSSEVYDLSKGTNLAESYNELARRKQAFTADLSQYNEKEAVIVQKAIDSGVLNNTNHTREFVDLVARLAAAKDLDFDFTTNQRLAESGFAIDGVTINGMVDKNTKAVTINLNSAKALETVVGHEITHILENTDLYTPLQEAVKQYATTKGEYDSRLEAITKLYANEEGADVVKELTADLVGDYIFSDADFVDSLAKGNRNLAQKILDEIKYMAKIATAGSKEKRQLEKAKKMLKDALEGSVKVQRQTQKINTKPNEMGRFSLSPTGTTESGKFMGKDIALEDEVINTEAKPIAPVAKKSQEVARTSQTDMSKNRAKSTSDDAERIASLLNDMDIDAEERIASLLDDMPKKDIKAEILAREVENLTAQRETSFENFNEAIEKKKAELESKNDKNTKTANKIKMTIERLTSLRDSNDVEFADRIAKTEAKEKLAKEGKPTTRQERYDELVADIKNGLDSRGMDLDDILDNGKRMHNIVINDTTPQRVNDKTFGYEQGEALNDYMFNKVALDESKAISWKNKHKKRLKALIKKYGIKPRSKQSAAAQIYAEGFYTDAKGELIKYGDEELRADFPKEWENIKKAAQDPEIRKMYDSILDEINESRTRNSYPEVPRRENYFLHFREEGDFFSKNGIPFNPNDVKSKDLPTDINGRTADLKPGQPYFSSSKQRKGTKTTYDLFTGLEKYIDSAAPQIFHIDNIQTERALLNYIATKYGQEHGFDNFEELSAKEQQEQIKKVFDGHLSNYARFLNEHANHLAGKTAMMDRAVESVIGRRALEVINTFNSQSSKNQVGFNVSSPLTNILPSMEAIAKAPKRDVFKAFAQTVANVFRSDGFVENDPTLIRRRGSDKVAKKTWEKLSDAGFVFMQLVDNPVSEFIVRTKYNELTRKGMSSEQAHIRAGQWAMRIMGDRSLGQMPLLYNSKTLGLLTKYQLEVRNALDSQFYDTVQGEKASTKDVENQLLRNAETAGKITWKVAQISVLNHVFGMVFEKIAGYNPSFDIISAISKLFGWDEEEKEDTLWENGEQAFMELLGDLPYTSLVTDGGRIPMSDVIPITKLITNKDASGQTIDEDKPYGALSGRAKTLASAVPYALPGGYGQLKKTAQGLKMFKTDKDHPITGSYTDSGKLRFPVKDTVGNRVQAAIFGQWASENAREYFDNNREPLSKKQTKELVEVNLPIKEYWEYRDGLKGLKTLAEKADYIYSLDLPIEKKNILINNIADRKKTIDLTNYGKYDSFEEFDYAENNPEKYEFLVQEGLGYEGYKNLDSETKDSWSWANSHRDKYYHLKENGIMPEDYSVYRISMLDFDDESNEAYEWSFNYPEKALVAKAVTNDVAKYRTYSKTLNDIHAGNDTKRQKLAYIDSLDIDDGAKYILRKMEYPSDDSHNKDIVYYLMSKDDIGYNDMVTILTELGMKVSASGRVSW